jgi:hypothetical protein
VGKSLILRGGAAIAPAMCGRERATLSAEAFMGIQWRHDIDQALDDARRENRPVLLDFSAAPM